MGRQYTLFIVSFLLGCAGCGDAPKRPEPIAVEIPECRVGDTCVFRPNFGSALVFTNPKAYQRFRRSNLETPDDSYPIYDDYERKGDWTVLQKGMQIRVLKEVDGGHEAMVEIDNWRPAPNGGLGYVGVRLANHKVWFESKLAPLSRWQRR
jgi:hypothetical protein